jgi:AcrR family transcriptional regulator
MGILERKTREKEERKKLILERAKELILERGISALSMQDIADATELSKATLYLYFQNKEAILAEILSDSADAFVTYVEDRLDPEDNGIEALRKLWSAYLSFFGESPDIFVLNGIKRFIYPNIPDRAEDDSEGKLGRLRRLISKLLERGVQDGTLEPTLLPDRIARIVIMIAMAIIDNVASLPRHTLDMHRIQEDMKGTFELMLRGLAATGTDRSTLTLPIGKE